MATPWSFLSAAETSAGIRRALASGDTAAADRYLTEATSRILLAPAGADIPADALSEPRTTGDRQYDTLLGTALAFALSRRGMEAPGWMLRLPALPSEWMWDGGYETAGPFKEFIKSHTPEAFLAKNILLRERDLIAP